MVTTLAVKRISDGKHFQCKKINLSKLVDTEITPAMLKERDWILKKFKHENIVAYEESFLENDQCIIISDLCGFTDLSTLIRIQRKKGEHFREDEILSLVDTCCRVLVEAEDLGIVHGGIHPGNIMVKEGGKGGVVKINNWGLSALLAKTHTKDISAI